jgi:predicted Ser/Thr protein kinase
VSQPLRPGDPRTLGAYRLIGRLGEGGMGTVYLARAADDRLVAVKVIRPEYAYEDEFRARFRSEVTRARQVPPFCTAEVLDADPDHRTPYLVVEYVDGPSLAEVIADQGPLTAGNLHSVAVGVATALAAIHGAGVIHRDLKPRNVLFSLGTPKVIDFGIARALEVTSAHTRTDQMVGTVSYMSPERFETGTGNLVGPPADVFAWGAVVAYAGTGRTPFHADSPAATAARILTQPPDLTGLTGSLRELVARTLAKDPRDRPTAHELLDLLLATDPRGAQGLIQQPELRRAAQAAQHTARLTTPARRTPRSRRLLTALLALLLLAGGGLYVTHAIMASLPTDPQAAAQVARAAASTSPSASRVVPGLSLVDRLDRPGQWTATPRDSGGGCIFAGQLVVTTSDSLEYQCTGPADTFSGNLAITVDAAVVTANACAVVWFRAVARSGYQVSLCPREVRLGLDNDGQLAGGEMKAPSAAFDVLRRRQRVTIAIHDNTATVSVAGSVLVTMPLTDPSLAAGQVILGALNDDSNGDSQAAFANLEIKSL